MDKVYEADLCIVGGGSGGYSAALRAAQWGIKTILVEKEPILGGTSTVCGVNCWEPVAGCAYGLPRQLYEKMSLIPGGCGIYHNAKHFCYADPARNDFPGGLYKIEPILSYNDTLKKNFVYGGSWSQQQELWNGIIFEPEVLHHCIKEMLEKANCMILTSTSCVQVDIADCEIKKIFLDNGMQICAKYWIDNCGILAAGKCRFFMGREERKEFEEEDAPLKPEISNLNGVTMLFRVRRKITEKIDPFHGTAYKKSMVATQYPNGDYLCNMLPTMTGREFFAMDRTLAIAECERRVKAFWNYVQENYEWGRKYEISKIFSSPGIRETFRIECEYMLNEKDLLAGLDQQKHKDMLVVADHHIDFHGAASSGKMVLPYGIPYRCLLPVGIENLLISGRIGGFSCIASASCRLTRTILRLGEAAGYAAALAVKEGTSFRSIDVAKLQELLQFDLEKEFLHL